MGPLKGVKIVEFAGIGASSGHSRYSQSIDTAAVGL